MRHHFHDILALTDQKPKWYDENGTPRFSDFHPMECPDIYAYEHALLLISCQNCGARFEVEMSSGVPFLWDARASLAARVRQWIDRNPEDKHIWPPLHYGDPPAHGCTGDTMNCYDLRVLQLWTKGGGEHGLEWERRHELEVELEEDAHGATASTNS